jgi:hypothetical protein
MFPLTVPLGLGVVAYMVSIGRAQHARYASMTFDHSWVEEAWAAGRKGRRKSVDPLNSTGAAVDSDGSSSKDANSTVSPGITPRANGKQPGIKSAHSCALLIPKPATTAVGKVAAAVSAGSVPAKQQPGAGGAAHSGSTILDSTSQQQGNKDITKGQGSGPGLGPRVLVRPSLETRPSASGEMLSAADEGDVDVHIEDTDTEVSRKHIDLFQIYVDEGLYDANEVNRGWVHTLPGTQPAQRLGGVLMYDTAHHVVAARSTGWLLPMPAPL